MGERIIHPKFNVHETYTRVNIINPYRFDTGGGGSTPPDEIAYFEMESVGSGLVDTYGGYNGTVTGNVTSISGKVGNAFKFGGAGSYATIPAITLPTNFAIEFWINTTSTGTEYILDRNADNGANRITIYNSGSTFVIRINGNSSIFNISLSQPNHIILTANGADFDTYLNGVIQSSGLPYAGISGELPIYLGVYKGGNDLYFTGWIDELKLHSKYLTGSEALARYNSYS